MLAACRTQENPYVPPKFDLTCTDVKGFLDELREFHQAFRSCFVRREPREHFLRYLAGQFSSRERKSIEPMALHIEGGNIRGMQRCISDDVWKADEMRRIYPAMVADEMGEPKGMMIFDESGFVKKGQDSVGVAPQYCGTMGKVENCQVGVFAAYASSKGYALVDKRLFLPEAWFDDDHTERRAKCRVPKEVTFETKPELAAQMLLAMRAEGVLPFRYIGADSVYGNSPVFLEAMDACVGCVYLVGISSETPCWVDWPCTTSGTNHAIATPTLRAITRLRLITFPSVRLNIATSQMTNKQKAHPDPSSSRKHVRTCLEQAVLRFSLSESVQRGAPVCLSRWYSIG